MRVAFVCGPYRGRDPVIQRRNIGKARTVALDLWERGFAVVCPHTNSGWFDGTIPEEGFREGYLHILRRCDVVVLVPGWEKSVGSQGEYDRAKKLGIPVYLWEPGEEPTLRLIHGDDPDPA